MSAASIPTQMTLSPQLGLSENISLSHSKPPLLILTFTGAVSSPPPPPPPPPPPRLLEIVGWLCWGLTSQSTIFQSCRDGAIASWVINQYFRGVKCLAQGHNTAAVGFEPRTSRSGVRHSTTEPPRSPYWRLEFTYRFSPFAADGAEDSVARFTSLIRARD